MLISSSAFVPCFGCCCLQILVKSRDFGVPGRVLLQVSGWQKYMEMG